MRFPSCWIAFLGAGILAAQPRLGWVTQIGGSGADNAAAIGRDTQGNLYVAGSTLSPDLPANGFQKRTASPGLVRSDNAEGSRPVQVPASPSLIAADQARSGVLYALTLKGPYRSTDSGNSWTALKPPLFLGVLAVRGDLVMGYAFTAAGTNFFVRSTDSGGTWQTVAALSAREGMIAGFTFDPAEPSIIVAWGAGSTWRSEDAGATWRSQAASVRLVTFDPAHPGRAWAVSRTNAVARSDDHGLTWRDVYTNSDPRPLAALTVDRQGVVYAGGPDGWIARSTDGTVFVRQGFGGKLVQLLADPDSGLVYANMGSSVAVSTDGFANSRIIGGTGNAVAMAVSGGTLFVAKQPGWDAFVAKLDSLGQVVWLTYLGGSGDDKATSLAVDSDGNVYVGGTSNSTDFPAIFRGRVQPGISAFAVKISSDGHSILWGNVWSDFSGGKLPVYATVTRGIAVDAAGRAYVAVVSLTSIGGFIGPAIRLDYTFLVQVDPGGEPGAVTEFGQESVVAIAASAEGKVWAASTTKIFRVPDLGAPVAVTTLPGVSIAAMALDARGVWVAGYAYSANIPTTPGALHYTILPGYLPGERRFASNYLAFLVRVNAETGTVEYAGLMGGEVWDGATALVVDSHGSPVVGGFTWSKGFPTRTPWQGPYNANTSFLARLRTDGSDLDYSTFVGDSRQFSVVGVSLDGSGNPVVLGQTARYAETQGDDVFLAQYLLDGQLDGQPGLRLDSVVNSASLLATALAPGARMTLRGAGFGSDARVFLSGVEAEVTLRSASEIAIRLPDLLSGPDQRITVESAGAVSNAVFMPVDLSAPGLYTVDGSGRGQGLVFNQDGSPNSIQNPAAPGSVVRIEITGRGRDQPLYAYIGGIPAKITGAAIATVEGIGEVFEIKAQVPEVPAAATAPASVALNIDVGFGSSQGGVGIAVGTRR